MNWRRVRSEELVTRRLVGHRKKRDRMKIRVRSCTYRPDLAKSSPLITPAPAILCRAII